MRRIRNRTSAFFVFLQALLRLGTGLKIAGNRAACKCYGRAAQSHKLHASVVKASHIRVLWSLLPVARSSHSVTRILVTQTFHGAGSWHCLSNACVKEGRVLVLTHAAVVTVLPSAHPSTAAVHQDLQFWARGDTQCQLFTIGTEGEFRHPYCRLEDIRDMSFVIILRVRLASA